MIPCRPDRRSLDRRYHDRSLLILLMPDLTPTQLRTLAMTLHQPLYAPVPEAATFVDTKTPVRTAVFDRLRDLHLIEPHDQEPDYWHPTRAGLELLALHPEEKKSTGREHMTARAGR